MTATSNYAWDREFDYKPIWRFKPADRLAEVERQLSAACTETVDTCVETELPIVEVTWVTSKFDTQVRVTRFASHGTSDPLDSNAKPAIVVSEPGDPNGRLRTLSQHMIGRIEPVICTCPDYRSPVGPHDHAAGCPEAVSA